MPKRLTPQTLRRLTYFAAIADAGSIREAARRLGLSVASISEALAALEEEIGTTLAVRNTRRLQLTEEGRRVEGIAIRVLDAGEGLFANEAHDTEITGNVALTAPVEIAQSWLPKRLEDFKKTHPKVGVKVSASDLVVDLPQSEFDIAIRARFLAPGKAGNGTHELPLTCVSSEPLKLSPHEDGWSTQTTLIAHGPEAHLDLIDHRNGKSCQIRFADVMLVDNKHVALAMVARNMGAALVSRHALMPATAFCECPEEFEFGHVGLSFEMRDKRASAATLALKNALDHQFD